MTVAYCSGVLAAVLLEAWEELGEAQQAHSPEKVLGWQQVWYPEE